MDQGDRPANELRQSRREGRGDESIDAHQAPLAEVFSVRGHRIRLTLRQWVHIIENHDYMAGNRELVLETIADSDELVEGEAGETLALRVYQQTNLTAKTAVVAYRDEPPDRVQAKGVGVLWIDYDAEGDVLYLSFEKPQQATDSVMGEDGNVYHYRGERLVGVTILHASKRAQEAAG